MTAVDTDEQQPLLVLSRQSPSPESLQLLQKRSKCCCSFSESEYSLNIELAALFPFQWVIVRRKRTNESDSPTVEDREVNESFQSVIQDSLSPKRLVLSNESFREQDNTAVLVRAFDLRASVFTDTTSQVNAKLTQQSSFCTDSDKKVFIFSDVFLFSANEFHLPSYWETDHFLVSVHSLMSLMCLTEANLLFDFWFIEFMFYPISSTSVYSELIILLKWAPCFCHKRGWFKLPNFFVWYIFDIF